MIIYCILSIICIIFSSFFSATETAYNFANKNHLKVEAENGKKTYKLAYKISEHYEKALTSILVGNNIANFALSACATLIVIELFSNWNAISNDSLIALVTTILTTIVTLIFGEILPKIIASNSGDKYAAVLAYPLFFIMIILTPIVFILSLLIKLIIFPFGKQGDEEATPEELASIIETGENEGSIDENRSELLQSTIDFIDTTIKEVMVSRVDAVMVDINDDKKQIIDLARKSEFSRIPVYDDSVDNIIGIFQINVLLKDLMRKKINDINIKDYLIDAVFLHDSVKLPDALDAIREAKQHLAIVLDEFGGTYGIVTMEDILEELVGDIWDEDELEDEEIKEKDNQFIVQGDMNIDDFLNYFGLDEDEFESECVTVGGWAIEMLDGFPKEKSKFSYKNLNITVEKIEEHRVVELIVEIDPNYVWEEEKSFFEKI